MKMADHSGKTRPPPATLDRLRAGCIVYKHDFHRTKRVRKLLFVDDSQGPGASAVLKWQNASGAPQPSPPPRSGLGIASPRPDSPAATPRRSASDGSSVSFVDIAQVCFGPYTRNFSRRSVEKRIDVCYRCFSLLLSSNNRSVDFGARRTSSHFTLTGRHAPGARMPTRPPPSAAFEDEADIMPWLLGLQQLVCYYAPTPIDQSMIWTEPKLHVQILRLKLQARML